MKQRLWIFLVLFLTGSGVFAQWTQQASGFTTASRGIRCIYAVSGTVVWASAYDGSGAAANCQDLTVTTNGGTLWTPRTVAGVTNLEIANLVAIDATTAWACMFPPGASATGQGIYKTTDGGVNWTRQATATFSNPSSFANLVYFWNANTGYCMGDPINGDFEIYTTSNGGTTWTLVPGANIPDPVSGEYGVIGYYSSVANVTWFGTNKGRIYKSIDNGLNWTVSAISGWSAKYVQPYFRDVLNGLVQDKNAGSTGALVRTTDGGATWTPVTTTGNVFTNDMAAIPGTASTWVSTGAATGATGVTYSFNDGTAWSDMTATIGTQYLGMDWIDNATGWAGGFNTSATVGGMYKFNSTLAVPVANFSANQTTIGVGGQVTFTDLSTGGPTSWSWSFPGGTPSSSTLQNPPPVTYAAAGQYNVTLTVTNSWGSDPELKTNYITVSSTTIPVANFSASQTTVATGGMVTFTDLTTGTPTSWAWSFPGGTPATSTLQSPPPITYSTVGQYDVTLTVTNNLGTDTEIKTNYITVSSAVLPAPEFTASLTTIFAGGMIQFTDQTTNNPVSWSWSFPGGTPSTSTQQTPPLILYSTAGQYDVTLTVTNVVGSATKTKVNYITVVNQVQPPVANFSGVPTTVTVGNQVQFTDLTTGAPTSWSWEFPGGIPATSTQQTPPPVTYNTLGQFDVILSVGNAGGGNTKLKVKYITVALPAAPVADFTANLTNIAVAGQVLFTDASTGTPTAWSWSFPGGTPATSTLQTPPAITYNVMGEYDVSLTATNAGGSNTKTRVKYIRVGNVGMGEKATFSALVYPNPASGYVTVRADRVLSGLTLLNQFGTVLLTAKPDAGEYTLRLDDIPQGVYFLRMESDAGAAFTKVVVSK